MSRIGKKPIMIKIKLAVLLAFFLNLFAVSIVQADDSFLNEPPLDSFPIVSLNSITPSILTITNITQDSVSLSWTKNTDTDFAYYNLYRIVSFVSVPPDVVLIAHITDSNQNSFADVLLYGTTYYYVLRTYNQTSQYVSSNALGALYVPEANITIDGSISDWSGITPSIQDYTNDKEPGSPSGTDIFNVYLAHDEEHFYARMDLVDGNPNTQDTVYYSISFDSRQEGHSIGDRYLYSQFFPGPGQNQSVLRQRTSIIPHEAVTITVEPATSGQNTLEMRTPLDKLDGGLLYFFVKASTAPGAETYYDGTIQMFIRMPRIFPNKAVSLAKDVLGAPYLGDGRTWGGKGFNCTSTLSKFVFPDDIKNLGYYFHDGRILGAPCSKEKDRGVDCSGLSFWSYNRAFYGDRKVNLGKCVGKLYKECPIAYEGADGQYRNNSYEIFKQEMKPGDLLFFDTEKDPYNTIDHVAMYIGENEIIHAEGKIFNKVTKENLETVLSRYGANFKGYYRVKDAKEVELQLRIASPASLVVADPEGIMLDQYIIEVPGIYRHIVDLDENGETDDVIDVPRRKLGDYLITVVPKPDALPVDSYTLKIEALINDQVVTQVLAENIPISDIPRTPYIIRSTETEIIPVIPAFIDFDPNTLNLKSKGQDVTVYIELSKGYDQNTIDLNSIKLNNQITPKPKPIQIGDYDHNGIPDLMVKFNRVAVQDILKNKGNEVKITITGQLTDGRLFQGGDTIKVINTSATAPLILLVSAGLIGCGVRLRNFQRNKKNSIKEGKITLLAILFAVIGILLFNAGIFGYHWYKTKGKSVMQISEKEILLKQIDEIKKISFTQCPKLKIFKNQSVGIELLDDVGGDDWTKHPGILIVLHPEGYGVGGYMFPLEMPWMYSHMPNGNIEISERILGDYLIIVALGDDVSSSDTYSLKIDNIILARDISLSLNLFDHLYILRQTEDGIIPIVPASVGCQY